MDLRSALILFCNLPGDDMTDVIETAKILSALPVQIVKITFSLYSQKDQKMYEEYKEGKITLCDPKEYLDRLVNFICYVRKEYGDRASIQQSAQGRCIYFLTGASAGGN